MDDVSAAVSVMLTYGKNVQKLDINAHFWSLMLNFER